MSTAPPLATAPARARRSGLDLLRTNRDFRALFIAQIISLGGDWFATVALLGIVGDLSSRPGLAKSMIFVAQSLPAFLVTPLAGPVADRFNRKKVMLAVSALSALVALGFLAIAPGRIWIAYAAQSALTALGAFFGPASQAAVANLVEPEDLPTAMATISATWGTMLAVGASVGGLFTKLFGRKASFVADAVSFAIAAGVLLLIKRRTDAGGNAARTRMRPIHDTREALAMARGDKHLRLLLPSKAGMGLANGVVGLLTVLSVKKFHAGDGGTGLLLAARGLGVVIGPLLAARLGGARNIPAILRVCAVSCLAYGVFYAGVAFSPVLAVAALFTLLAHVGGGAQWTLSTIGLTIATPDEFRGRILSADFALVTLSMSISLVAGGLIGDHFGARAGLLILGSVAVIWGLFYLRLTSKLRNEAPAA